MESNIRVNEDDDEATKLLRTINNQIGEHGDENKSKKESIFLNRYFALLLMGFSLLGQNFVVDNPAALEDVITEQLHITNAQFSSFYSFYNWPNVILCIINGYVIDKLLGCRLSVILFTVLMTTGQIIFSFGAYHKQVLVMQAGRFIFGFGGESIYVAIFKYCSRWFSNSKQLNMAITFLYCVPNMGSVMNMYVMPLVYNSINLNTFKNLPSNQCLGITLLVGDCVSIFSLLCGILLAIIDKKKHKFDTINSNGRDVHSTLKIRDIWNFPFQFWLLVLTCITYYSVVYPFVGNIKLFYMFKYKLSSYHANICNSLVYTISAALSPFIGLLIDNVGYNLYWIIFGILTTIGTHCLIAFTYSNPFLNSTLLGTFFTFMSSAIFPSVPLIISEDRLGTAYGIIQSIQNLGVAATGTAIGYLVDLRGYFFLDLIFINYLGICLCGVFVLFIFDTIKEGRLNKPASVNRQTQAKLQNTTKSE